jgi:GTPase SAR1 family protein
MPPKRGNSTTASPSPPRANQEEVTLKIVCVGAAASGKSTFLKFWETNQQHHHLRSTIQMEFHKLEMDVELPLADNPAAVQAITSYKALGSGNNSSALAASDPQSGANLGSSLVSSSSFLRGQSSGALTSPTLSYKLTVPELPQYGGCSENRRAIVKVWDIQGQENTKFMTRPFYSGAVGALVFCEITQTPDSLDSAVLWKKDICQKVFVQRADKSEENPPCWLVVNKYDVLKDMPPASYPAWASRQQLDQFCEANGFSGWSYAAGLKGLNVKETVEALVAASIARFPAEIRSLSQAGQAQGVNMQRTRRQQKPADTGCCGSKT